MARRHLTRQQRARIRAIQEQRRQKLAKRAEPLYNASPDAPAREGRVIIRHGATLGVESVDGHIYQCLTRQNIGHPVCGDRVVWQQIDHTTGVVSALLPRRSVLSRPDYSGHDKPLAANISQLVVVLAPRPEPSGYLLDQYLVTAATIKVRPLIAINKIDLLVEPDKTRFLERFNHYRQIGYALIEVSAKQDHGMDELVEKLKHETNILVGQSGVGKSSLIKALIPDLKIVTGKLSEATGLGRHTTSAATCYHLPLGGYLIDSPGVRSFRLSRLSVTLLEQGFPELGDYLGHCRFHNCSHEHEPGCAVRQAEADGKIHPQRLENFLQLRKRILPP
ncbi:MAG: small ribosomal subunit biogenesis GTPase RsgA [Gammaproteobacteria bacterium]|nr:small ribosomal subunit biogenesis GTPase RsgA [Gammaproteobacteria bacterium]